MRSQTEIRQGITNAIIESLSSNSLPPWRRTWNDDPNAGMPTSLSTGNRYGGINSLILQCSAIKQNFKSKWWGTFRQIQADGASVRKGQKATKVVIWKPINRTRTDETGKEVDDRFFFMQEFAIFNAEQTTGLDNFRVGNSQPTIDSDARYQHADEVIDATGVKIQFGGNRAFYSLNHDTITMPYRHQFESPEAYYETLFHECIHWGVTRSEYERNNSKESYAFEELVAELGSCFAMGELSLNTTANMENHASYLKHWLSEMANDAKYIFKASALSSKIVDHVLSFSRKSDEAESTLQPAIAQSTND